jgi:RNA polymerase sigma-70 factor (ECF subfamily)
MTTRERSDDELLAARDPDSFEVFYLRHVHALLAYFARRTGDPELAADLTAETFAAALAARRRYRPARGPAIAWVFGIASHKLADAQRRGCAEQAARRRLGMERLVLTERDVAEIEALAESITATAWLDPLTEVQRSAVQAHVIDGRGYDEIARAHHTTEAVIRKRVSRGLAAVRERMGSRP